MATADDIREALEAELDPVRRVAEALAPILEPRAGSEWERFDLSVWVRKMDDGALRFDGWDGRFSPAAAPDAAGGRRSGS